MVCWWEDDGQDDDDATQVYAGPNGKYSLAAARVNFSDHGDMYDPGYGISAVKLPSKTRLALLQYVRRVAEGVETLNEAKLKQLTRAESKALK